MRLELDYLRLKNFRSFRGEHQISLRKPPGLYVVQGFNEVDPALGSNGAGKTSLFETISWVPYNRTSKGRRSHQILNWSDPQDGVLAELGFRINGRLRPVRRGHKPTYLVAVSPLDPSNEKPLEDSDVLGMLNLSFSEFLSSIFVGQFSSVFFDLGPAQKLEFMSKLLGLDYWDECSKQASQLRKGFEQQYAEVQTKQQTLSATLVEVKKLVEAKASEIKLVQMQDVSGIEKALSLLDKELEDNKSSVDKAKDKVAQARNAWQKAELGMEPLQKKIGELGQKLRKISQQRSSLLSELGGVKTQISRLRDGLSRGICPVCKRKLDSDKHVQQEISGLELKQGKLGPEIEKLDVEEKEVVKQSDETNEGLRSKQSECTQFRDGYRSAQSKLDLLLQESGHLATRRRDLENQHRMQTERKERLQEEHRKASLRARSIGYELEGLNEKQGQFEIQVRSAEYWVKGFQHLRMLLLEEALRRFEVEATNALASLGLPTWSFRCVTERETKSGTISRGIRFLVCRPGREAYDLEDESGGELQRIRLAGTVGLSTVILERRGVEPGFEVWDEPTRHLSQEGIQDLLSVLSVRAEELGRAIFLIDHHSLDTGKASGIIRVTKDGQGSRVEWV